ncbi:PhzF family phenazine biosynthesis protein [Actinotalea ferrariae]|uniref:PhzF family phenazine biosynthesis protein n=1 Tax=Actinotalea ferrariae TaxID=1386098 RepID=UPI001C8CBA84|nr:PhzF family phenazine biosynthesis protein [Actinotalea ferrariae]MBX9246431.1 PhzF family phenazine biosynthesis protein [Actinotalea ferrariae]
MRLPIFQLDAFTTRRFAGNPAAVVLLDAFPDDALMQAVAAENNLAETAFLVPSGDRYRLRWFTPTVEVPLCGHATLASGAVVLERLEPGRERVAFDTASGALTVTREEGRYAIDLPARAMERVPVPEALTAALGVAPVEVLADDGNYLAVLAAPDDVRTLTPDVAAIARLDLANVIVTAPGDGSHDVVSRYFAPGKGIPEDPVTGGAHCALVPYWAARTGKDSLLAYQASPRGGELDCRLRGGRVELRGSVAFYLEGHIEI